MSNTSSLNQWIEIDREAYHHNLSFFRSLLGKNRELCLIVKANAYGHGIKEIVKTARMSDAGVDSFGVHSLDEALELRESGVNEDILIMGYTPIASLSKVVEHDLRQVVYDLDTLRTLDLLGKKCGRKAKVHLKVETGTNRQGVSRDDLGSLLSALQNAEGIYPEGIYTHFANIEDTTRHHYAKQQIKEFLNILDRARDRELVFPRVHSACSAAALLFPDTWGDMVRVGISQYGLWPSRETFLSYKLKHSHTHADVLKPVLSWKCRISQIKDLAPGSYVGYGCTYLTTRPTRLAVLPVGYSDGFDRALSNTGHVLVKGRRAQIRGRICMNLVMVDVTDIEGVEKEDEVVLLGNQGKDRISAEDHANTIGTINYEVVARIRSGIPRIIK